MAELKEKEIVGPGGSVAAPIELSTATDTELPSASGDLSRTLSEYFCDEYCNCYYCVTNSYRRPCGCVRSC